MSQETEENYQEAHLSKYGLIVANHIGAMVAYWDTNLVCRFANKVYGEWFGRTPDEMIDKVTAKELLGSIFEKNLPYFKGALNGQVQTFERTLTISSGEVRHTLANYYPHFVKGEVKGVIVHVVRFSPYYLSSSYFFFDKYIKEDSPFRLLVLVIYFNSIIKTNNENRNN